MSAAVKFSFLDAMRAIEKAVLEVADGEDLKRNLYVSIKRAIQLLGRRADPTTLGLAQYDICWGLWESFFQDSAPRPFPPVDRAGGDEKVTADFLAAALDVAICDPERAIQMIHRRAPGDGPKPPSQGWTRAEPSRPAARTKDAEPSRQKAPLPEAPAQARPAAGTRDAEPPAQTAPWHGASAQARREARVSSAARPSPGGEDADLLRRKLRDMEMIFQVVRRGDAGAAPPPPSVHDQPPRQPPAVTSAPGVGGVGGGGGVPRPAPPQPRSHCRFGPWRDGEGRELPTFSGAGPGEVVLPDNMNPFEHVLPAKQELEEWLYVRIHVEGKSAGTRHPTIHIWPWGGSTNPAVTAMYGLRAFQILSSWTCEMARVDTMIPVLDYVTRSAENLEAAMTKKIADRLAPMRGRAVFPKPVKAIDPPSKRTRGKDAQAPHLARDVASTSSSQGDRAASRAGGLARPRASSTGASAGRGQYGVPEKARRVRWTEVLEENKVSGSQWG
ncbi:hypothetical protein F4781DRAFT_430258 [Annulohypoxylon bovei var. microspora]|nr:hypothetical protein F4781DRAFT_430258 [Annulohypoxylon bovei var. microspora]